MSGPQRNKILQTIADILDELPEGYTGPLNLKLNMVTDGISGPIRLERVFNTNGHKKRTEVPRPIV